MNIKFHSPTLICNNLNQLKDFYIKVLNQEVSFDFGSCIVLKCGISLWKIPENHKIAKLNGQTYFSEGNKNLELTFETENFEASVKSLIKHKVKLMHNAELEPWGQKTIRFYDPEDNLIEIGETIPTFVKRMQKEGMSAKQIAEKTSVPLNNVLEYIS